MELTPRLRKAAELVPQGARFADIGTDHAYLPVWLILNGVIDRAIAADLREGPLNRARDTAEKYGVSEQIQFRLCDGLAQIKPEEADTIAIAGMGGETIAHILDNAPWTKQRDVTLILQPMSSQPDLRQWLGGHGYRIEEEHVVREGKVLYNVLVARAGVMEPMTAAELLAGRQSRDPMRGELLEFLIAKTQRALRGRLAAAQRDEAAVKELNAVLKGLCDMREEWRSWQR